MIVGKGPHVALLREAEATDRAAVSLPTFREPRAHPQRTKPGALPFTYVKTKREELLHSVVVIILWLREPCHQVHLTCQIERVSQL